MKKVTIDKISFKDGIEYYDKKTQKKGIRYGIGIQVNGDWHNATAFGDKQLQEYKKLEEGKEYNLIFFKEEGKGDYAGKTFDKFRFPRDTELLTEKLKTMYKMLTELESRVDKLEGSKEPLIETGPKINKGLSKIDGETYIEEAQDDLPF